MILCFDWNFLIKATWNATRPYKALPHFQNLQNIPSWIIYTCKVHQDKIRNKIFFIESNCFWPTDVTETIIFGHRKWVPIWRYSFTKTKTLEYDASQFHAVNAFLNKSILKSTKLSKIVFAKRCMLFTCSNSITRSGSSVMQNKSQ